MLIEVADSSLRYDREVKAIAYAKSGIADYWILDVNQRKLHVYRSTGIIATCKLRSLFSLLKLRTLHLLKSQVYRIADK
ncbi:Uma2 family endonuclease [Tolypothrix sp. VBCCA 56010]|uniref:Uma2 family endonuclease n=1 Tax=Tolypothrix sp. VBCCA 56010 TaxID=3137731 RepID=UPI003D7CB60A